MGIDPGTMPTWLVLVVLALVIAVLSGLALWAWRSSGRERWWRVRTASPGDEQQEPGLHTRHQWE